MCISFFSKAQERQDVVRQKLQLSIDAQSNMITHIPGWSKIENKEGKFWKQSNLDSTVSYLPCCPDDGFQSLQTFKFTLEGETFYLLSIIYDSRHQRVFAFKSSSLQDLQNVIDKANGQAYYALPIEYCEYFTKSEDLISFNPESFIKKNKSMIRLLLTGSSEYLFDNWCKNCYIFQLQSQILKGEKIIRFDIIPWENGSTHPTKNFTTLENNYFELNENSFENLFRFSPYKDSSIGNNESLNSPNNAKYDGEYKDGKMSGQGKCIWSNGTKYVGEFKDGLICGRGTKTWSNGDKCECDWKDNLRNGQGTFIWSNGDKYEGEWKNDMRNGQGTYTWLDGTEYIGEWKDNERTVGKFSISDKSTGCKFLINPPYEVSSIKWNGTCDNGYLSGYGKLDAYNSDSTLYFTYTGNTLNGRFNGMGTKNDLKYSLKYVGEWKDGLYNGQGTLYIGNKSKKSGTWVKGKLSAGKSSS